MRLFIKIQKITRQRAREAAQEETPRHQEACGGLCQLIAASQKDDPFSRRVLKELATPEETTHTHYSTSTDGFLLYKDSPVEELVHELMWCDEDIEIVGAQIQMGRNEVRCCWKAWAW
jgi:hypothetical protein